MISLKLLNSFFKERMLSFLILSLICIEYAIGGGGAGSSRGSKRGKDKQIMQSGSFSFDSDVPTQYDLGIYTRRFDGGSVLVLEDGYDNLKKDAVVNIEDILEALGLLNVEYIRDGQVNVVKKYKNIPGVGKGVMNIENIVGAIADWEIGNSNSGVTNWLIQEKPSNNPIFEPLFDGHVMVMFFNGEQEKFRLHLTSKGLNFYDTARRTSYFVGGRTGIKYLLRLEIDNENRTEASSTRSKNTKEFLTTGKRATRCRNPYVHTRQLNLHQIINIAYKKVTRGRNIVPHFKCRHFVYEFIIAIADNSCKSHLFNYESWPEGIRSLDDFFAVGGVYAFNQVIDDINEHGKYQKK